MTFWKKKKPKKKKFVNVHKDLKLTIRDMEDQSKEAELLEILPEKLFTHIAEKKNRILFSRQEIVVSQQEIREAIKNYADEKKYTPKSFARALALLDS